MADVYDFFKAAARLGRKIDPPAPRPAETPSRTGTPARPIFRPTGPFAEVSSNLLGVVKTLAKVETVARAPDLPAGADVDR